MIGDETTPPQGVKVYNCVPAADAVNYFSKDCTEVDETKEESELETGDEFVCTDGSKCVETTSWGSVHEWAVIDVPESLGSEFYISDYSIVKEWSTNDYGTSCFGIYAVDYEHYYEDYPLNPYDLSFYHCDTESATYSGYTSHAMYFPYSSDLLHVQYESVSFTYDYESYGYVVTDMDAGYHCALQESYNPDGTGY